MDRLYLPFDGTDESLRAIQAVAPGAFLLDDEAVADAPLVGFRGSNLVAFPGDTVTLDRGTGEVGVIEGSEQELYERERSRAGAGLAPSPSQQR